MACNALIEGFTSVRGGVRESRDLGGPHAFLTACDVTLWAKDGRRLAAALRRAAAEIELETLRTDKEKTA